MNGRIKMYNENRAFGFIAGDNGSDYFFHISSFKSACQPSRGLPVSFDAEQQEKGLVAKNICVSDNLLNRPQFIIFGEERIKLTNIKHYGLASGVVDYVRTFCENVEISNRKTLFGTKTKQTVTLKENGQIWIHDYNDWYYTTLRVEIFDSKKKMFVWLNCRFNLEDDGTIHRFPNDALQSSDHVKQAEDYLYVKTYQGDSYRWYSNRAGFNIYEKCKELDKYMT